ncbi:hypothetical protein [Geodermatophilus sp. DSM 45219]|uniref:pPIWI-associating nuclease domain-containing protein n=1 Tax=Geodermatophilus sp. DSM 45219 TaxID=1881103 RepID=UPI00088E76C1|nr:hypothetical protein [Geodermatophilus sp. DSM 45219]SDN41804.1 hypothetical protein SAMN05428965_0310 [Geodermatophilus sp. DSM 45219]
MRQNRSRLRAEIARLQSQSSRVRYQEVRTSAVALHETYLRADADFDAGFLGGHSASLLDLAEGEAANSARVANALLGEGDATVEVDSTSITDELSSLSGDLDSRWRGALYALNPQNPDAARHFCTSSREVLVQMLEIKAPDAAVLQANPQCQRTPQGQPLRREKINYLLALNGESSASLGEFIDEDVNDVMNLFRVFNDGTHGDAGTFDLPALRAIKGRVEGAIGFLSQVIRGAAPQPA